MKYLLIAIALLITGCANLSEGMFEPSIKYADGPADLETVNQHVNNSMKYVSDTEDKWTDNCPTQGDCEDFAMCKAKQLINQGYAKNRVAILVGLDKSRGVHHAVTLVDGKWIMSNIGETINSENKVRRLDELTKFGAIYSCTYDNVQTNYFISSATNKYVAITSPINPNMPGACAKFIRRK